MRNLSKTEASAEFETAFGSLPDPNPGAALKSTDLEPPHGTLPNLRKCVTPLGKNVNTRAAFPKQLGRLPM